MSKIGYTSVRPFLYFDHFHIFDLFFTSSALVRPLYFARFTSARLHTALLYFDLFANLDLSLVEKYRSKYSFGRSTEKIEDMKMVEVQKRSYWCVPLKSLIFNWNLNSEFRWTPYKNDPIVYWNSFFIKIIQCWI